MEELLLRLRPKQDKSDAELLREKLEAQMNDAELNFYEVSSQEHAQNVMDICDRVVKNESLTITELQIGLDHPVYGEFVTWLLGDRHHNFRAIDADHSHTLELEEIIHAIDLFKAMKQEEKAKEEYDRMQQIKDAEDAAMGIRRDQARRESYATMQRNLKERERRARSPAEHAARGIMKHCDVQNQNHELTISELQGGLVNTQYTRLLTWLLHHSHFGKFDVNGSNTLNIEELTKAVMKYLEENPDDTAITQPSRPQTREKAEAPSAVPERHNAAGNVRV